MSERVQIRSGLVSSVLALGSNLGALLEHDEKPWSSPTYAGARHTMTLEFKGGDAVEAGERFIALLPDHKFLLSGFAVDDATIRRAHFGLLPEPRLEIEAVLMLREVH